MFVPKGRGCQSVASMPCQLKGIDCRSLPWFNSFVVLIILFSFVVSSSEFIPRRTYWNERKEPQTPESNQILQNWYHQKDSRMSDLLVMTKYDYGSILQRWWQLRMENYRRCTYLQIDLTVWLCFLFSVSNYLHFWTNTVSSNFRFNYFFKNPIALYTLDTNLTFLPSLGCLLNQTLP